MSGLGRIAKADPRDWPLRAAGIVPVDLTTVPHTHYWSARSLPLDQGDSPQCVGYTGRGLLLAGPVINRGGPDAATIYRNAQLLDEIPGEDYDGTTARGMLKYLQSLGYVSAYVWPTTVAEAVTMLQRGPIALGCDWYSIFDNPGTTGVLRIAPGAHIRGGHEFLIVGYSLPYQRFRMVNSWGRSFAQSGRAWLPFDVFTRLMDDGGDCAAPTELRQP